MSRGVGTGCWPGKGREVRIKEPGMKEGPELIVMIHFRSVITNV